MNSIYIFIKLALLSFYPNGTKISINNNTDTISIRPPSLTQGIIRWAMNESRKEIIDIKIHIQNIMILLSNGNFKCGDTIIYNLRKSLNKLKICYLNTSPTKLSSYFNLYLNNDTHKTDTQSVKELLQVLEEDICVFYNNKGKNDLSIINIKSLCNDEQKKIILGKWKLTDIQFINYNFKCIMELDKNTKNDMKEELKQRYISIINEYIDHININ